ncbi:MAG: glycosidase, partial [Gorillibacterium sp.]|nr:glycosidase [Gorillibacterium sp.]
MKESLHLLNEGRGPCGPFIKKQEVNPCLTASTELEYDCPLQGKRINWEEKDVFNPAAVVYEGKVQLLYRAEDTVGQYAGTSRIGLAVSEDGYHFTKRPQPVLAPGFDDYKNLEWDGGCEDPRVVEDNNGTFFMSYTAFDGHLARLCMATSTDLVNWTKHGLAFGRAKEGKYSGLWSKSGSIVCEAQGDRLIAKKIGGKYWMYWGESNVYAATSDNLIDWTPYERHTDARRLLNLDNVPGGAVNEKGDAYIYPVFTTRQGRFDSCLVEPGPPAVWTEKGIVFLYNCSNHSTEGDPSLAPGTYAPGQIVLDALDPTVVVSRCTQPFLLPELDYEISGQTMNTCFIEGLVFFGGK